MTINDNRSKDNYFALIKEPNETSCAEKLENNLELSNNNKNKCIKNIQMEIESTKSEDREVRDDYITFYDYCTVKRQEY